MKVSYDKESVPIFSFADSELGFIQNTIIRFVERFTGQPTIRKIYSDYMNSNRPYRLFWQDSVDRLKLKVKLSHDEGAYIPEKGPLLVIANHPFGIIDGVILCSEISKKRDDYKIITHKVLRQSPAVKHQILPINFEESDDAVKTNIETRKAAIKQIESGGVIILFPAGAISIPRGFFGTAIDTNWKTFAAKLANIENTTVLPVFFEGKNSLTYTTLRKVSVTLGYSLMFREVRRRINTTIKATMRKPIPHDKIKSFGNRNELMAFLREKTYNGSQCED